MRVVINQEYAGLSERLVKEINNLAEGFNNKNYLKIENINNLLLRRDISVEGKKRILIKKLHEAITKAFSIDKKGFNKKTFDGLKKRLHNIRKIINKLRSINYYLETMFLEDLKLSKIKIIDRGLKLRHQNALARDELEALEYTTYKLIEEAVMLDKTLLREYINKERRISGKERVEVKDIGLIFGKESRLLEHLEAKLPPPKATNLSLIKEPTFTHWVARIFALLSCLEHLYAKETIIFSKLKKNKSVRMKIGRKVIQLMKEKSKLLRIMKEKAISMEKFGIHGELKEELHNLTTMIRL